MIKDQCERCKIQTTCLENKLFDGNSCEKYRKKIDLEKHSDGSGENIITEEKAKYDATSTSYITREFLKANTTIHGWLVFFLVAIVLGGLISAIYPIVTFNPKEYGGSAWLSVGDVIYGFMLFATAILTVVSFSRRNPDAVFLAKTYVLVIFATNLLSVFVGDYEDFGMGSLKQLVRSLIWSVIWFCYLTFSKQVNEVIPKVYRRRNKFDRIVLGILVGFPLLAFGIGVYEVINKTSVEEKLFVENVSLKDNEYTDGRVVFANPNPNELEVEQSEVEGILFFRLEDDNASITIVSDYDGDQSSKNINEYWDSFRDPEVEVYVHEIVVNDKRYINGLPYYYKVVSYDLDSFYMYWRFVIVFDNASSKMCVISAYDFGVDDYLDTLLNSIRFH